MPKNKQQLPQNFVDLRQPQKQQRPLLIQDVWNSAPAKRFRLLPGKWQVGALAGLIFVVTALFVSVQYMGHPSYYFPADIRKSARFQLYYPTKLPTGMYVVPNSIHGDGQAVLYTVADGQNHKFFVSIQPLPQSFDYEQFKKKFTDTDETLVNTGSALTGDAGYALIGSIRTADNTWILINAPDTSTGSAVQALTRSFEKVD